jgi:hypothetical protein
MAQQTTKRQSICIICGKRLSTKTATGDIKWQTSHVDDKGMYCDDCYAAKGPAKGKKAVRPHK